MEICIDELTKQTPYELGKDLKLLNVIDHGAFGTVLHVKEISTNNELAVKVINKKRANPEKIKKMKEEILILKQLNHKNIVKYFGYIETTNQILIKMEYIQFGTLKSWMKKKSNITEEEASIIIRRVLSAIEYVHGKQICHRDIKPDNIMLSKEDDLDSIKIIDFGLSAQDFYYLNNNEYCGTLIYMAPEQIQKKMYFLSVDIWSIGILMYMLLNNGTHPFYYKGIKREDYINNIKESKLSFKNKLSPMAENLLKRLLEPNPSSRYSPADSLKHPWITRNYNDKIPLTLNDFFNERNNKKIMQELIMISLFFNFFGKKNLQKKKKIFKIDKDYINNCDYISNIKKEYIQKLKERSLDVLSSDEENEEKSYEKKMNSIKEKMKSRRMIRKYSTPKKKLTKIFLRNERFSQIDLHKKISCQFQSINQSQFIKPVNVYIRKVKSNKNIHIKKSSIKNLLNSEQITSSPILVGKNKTKNEFSSKTKTFALNPMSEEKMSNQNIDEHSYMKSRNNLSPSLLQNCLYQSSNLAKPVKLFHNINNMNAQFSTKKYINCYQKNLLDKENKINLKSNLPDVFHLNNIHIKNNLLNEVNKTNQIEYCNIIPIILPSIKGSK